MRASQQRILLSLAVCACIPAARGADIFGVLPAALDQPQINAIVYLGDNTVPQYGDTTTLDDNLNEVQVRVFNIAAYLDTGSSSIVLSVPTTTFLNVPIATQAGTGTPITYSDVSLSGSDEFNVSVPVRLSLANYYPRTDLDQFSDPEQTQPITTPYTPLAAPVRVEIGPPETDVNDPIDQVIEELNSIEVVGMPAMTGKVVVMDPTRVNNFGQLLDGEINLDNLTDLPDVFMRTYVYNPGTPFHAATADTDPGIPHTSLHVKLSYGSFDQFSTVTPAGEAGPTLAHNPFIGKDPVAVLEGKPTADVPGIKISRTITVDTAQGPQDKTLTSEGNWLLDSGAAASIISRAQAANLGVTYKDGTFGTDTPDLVDQNGVDLPNQFTLALNGISGTETLAGFYLDALLVRTMEGSATNDDDPNNIRFFDAPVLVGDITLKDPVSGEVLTLDGVFGMNNLVASADISAGDLVPTINALSTGAFDWITFDEPDGILGLDIATVPEPASLSLLGAGLLCLALRRRSIRAA